MNKVYTPTSFLAADAALSNVVANHNHRSIAPSGANDHGGTRTRDFLLVRQALSQLSYATKIRKNKAEASFSTEVAQRQQALLRNSMFHGENHHEIAFCSQDGEIPVSRAGTRNREENLHEIREKKNKKFFSEKKKSPEKKILFSF